MAAVEGRVLRCRGFPLCRPQMISIIRFICLEIWSFDMLRFAFWLPSFYKIRWKLCWMAAPNLCGLNPSSILHGAIANPYKCVWLICFKFRVATLREKALISHIWHRVGHGGLLFDLYMGWRGWLLEIPEAGFRGRFDSRVKWEGSIALGWLDWGCMGVLAGGAPVMNRVFDYLRLALKGRTKTLGQRLRASQLSYRMLGRVFLPPCLI